MSAGNSHRDKSSDDDNDMWLALRHNYVYVSEKLRITSPFLSRLYEKDFLSRGDFDTLRDDNTKEEDRVYQLLVKILPCQSSVQFIPFCNVLTASGQQHIADRLLSHPCLFRLLPAAEKTRKHQENSNSKEVEMTSAECEQLKRTLHLERESKKQQERRALLAESLAQIEKERADRFIKMYTRAMAENQELQLTTLGMRYAKSRKDQTGQITNGSLSWKLLNNTVPSRLHIGSLAECNEKLLIAGKCGDLRVLTNDKETWETFVRDQGDIRRVVAYQGMCLVLVYDEVKHHFVIEQFCMDEENKWRPVAVLPKEHQLSCVSIALQDNLLYAVGGLTSPDWKRVTTAHVYDLRKDQWDVLEDMSTKRSGCSCVILNDSVYVGSGWTDDEEPCHTVECLRKGSRYWKELTSYPIRMSTMTAFGNTILSTGGQNADNSLLNEVQLFDGRCREWHSLPPMTRNRSWHGLVSTERGEIIAAGGEILRAEEEHSMESLRLT